MRVSGIMLPGGYALQVGGPTTVAAPADATTYFFGQTMINNLDTTGDRKRIYIPRSGVVRAIYCTFQQTAGSAETSTISFRLNNTTDTTISSAVVNNVTGLTVVSNLSLAIPVIGGIDYFELKWVTPTWATNPTNFTFSGLVWIELN